MASESNIAFPMNNNLVDNFEEAFQVELITQNFNHEIRRLFIFFLLIFQGIINGFTKEDGLSHSQDNKEELRTDAEQNVSKFIEVAKQLETFFLQRRLQFSVIKPDQLVKEVKNCSFPSLYIVI